MRYIRKKDGWRVSAEQLKRGGLIIGKNYSLQANVGDYFVQEEFGIEWIVPKEEFEIEYEEVAR